MKKLSVLTAVAIIGWAGQALAQVTQTLTATANIDAVLTLNANQPLFECGTVAVGSALCDTLATKSAEFEVISNSDWTLTLADDAVGSTANQITLSNTDAVRAGEFVLALVLSAYSGTATGSTVINVTEAATTSITGLGNDDDWGSYSGTGTLTLTGS